MSGQHKHPRQAMRESLDRAEAYAGVLDEAAAQRAVALAALDEAVGAVLMCVRGERAQTMRRLQQDVGEIESPAVAACVAISLSGVVDQRSDSFRFGTAPNLVDRANTLIERAKERTAEWLADSVADDPTWSDGALVPIDNPSLLQLAVRRFNRWLRSRS